MNSTNHIENELNRRQAMVSAISATVDRLFDISPTTTHNRMRRDEVHAAIGKATGILILKSIPARKLVIEVLKAKGVKLITNSGRRYFKGLGEKCRTS